MLEIIAIIGLLLSAGGAAYQHQAQKKASNINKENAQRNAAEAKRRADLQSQQLDKEKQLRMGAVRAQQGAFGGTMEGSALDIMGDNISQLELQQSEVRHAGAMAAAGYDSTAQLDDLAAKSSERQMYSSAGRALLSSGESYYGNKNRVIAKD